MGKDLKEIGTYLVKMHLYKKDMEHVFESVALNMDIIPGVTKDVDKLHINKINAQAHSKFVFYFVNLMTNQLNTNRLLKEMNSSVEPNGHFVIPYNEDKLWNNISKQYLYNMLYEYALLLSKEQYDTIVKLIENDNIDYEKQDDESLTHIYWIVDSICVNVLRNYFGKMDKEYNKLSFIQKLKAGFNG